MIKKGKRRKGKGSFGVHESSTGKEHRLLGKKQHGRREKKGVSAEGGGWLGHWASLNGGKRRGIGSIRFRKELKREVKWQKGKDSDFSSEVEY